MQQEKPNASLRFPSIFTFRQRQTLTLFPAIFCLLRQPCGIL